METPPGLAPGLTGVGLKRAAAQGILERLTPGKHCRLASKQTLVSLIIGLLFFVSSETILAVKRPPYPIKAEVPDAGHWVIISTTEKTK
jgi:hypothetical protein